MHHSLQHQCTILHHLCVHERSLVHLFVQERSFVRPVWESAGPPAPQLQAGTRQVHDVSNIARILTAILKILAMTHRFFFGGGEDQSHSCLVSFVSFPNLEAPHRKVYCTVLYCRMVCCTTWVEEASQRPNLFTCGFDR